MSYLRRLRRRFFPSLAEESEDARFWALAYLLAPEEEQSRLFQEWMACRRRIGFVGRGRRWW